MVLSDGKSIFKEVFSHSGYLFLAIFIAGLVTLITIWLPNHKFIWYILTGDTFVWSAKIKILGTSLGAFKTNLTLISQITLIVVALLAGLNLSLASYYFKQRVALEKLAGTSLLGIIGGFLGIGCSACGSVVLSSLFGVAATSVVIGLLPLHGAEFGLLSILLLFISLYFIIKKINSSVVCVIKK